MNNYSTLNDIITDEEVLQMAKEHIENGTTPYFGLGTGKSTLALRIWMAMFYLEATGKINE